MSITLLSATKFVATNVVAVGVGKIAKDIITNNVNDPESVIQKVTIYTGAAVLGMMAKDASKAYLSAKIDSEITDWKAAWKKYQDKKIETPEEVVSEDSDPT